MSEKPTFRETIMRQAIPSQIELAAKSALEPTMKIDSPFGAINFDNLSPADAELCVRIAGRGAAFMRQYKVDEDQMQAGCDIAVVHCNDGPLELLRFMMADVTDFAHDYSRIRRFLNRQTGRMHLPLGEALLFKKVPT